MPPIHNFLFDLGNVLIDLDLARSDRMLRALLGERYTASFVANEQAGVFERYELGQISEAEFLGHLRRYGGTDGELIAAWNAMLIGLPAHRLVMLDELRTKGYGVYLLSNTNATHIDWVTAYLRRTYGITDFSKRYFDKAYYSHLIHRRKPNVATYEWVLQDAGIEAATTLFIDDNLANVEGARAAGLRAHHHGDGRDVVAAVRKYITFE